ncbi:MAG: hypothetical protein OXU23_22455 [Candidatus Poribacteria bacterium]|nr:hypothetical protein [Candidatus Poribacteria bacterium]
MKRLRSLALVVLSLALISLSLPSTAERKGSTGENNPDVYGEVYMSSIRIIWERGGIDRTESDHDIFVCNYSGEDVYDYAYDFQHALYEFDPMNGELGNWIAEDREQDSGSVRPYNENGENNYPDYLADISATQSLSLNDHHLNDGEWYAISAWTDLSVTPQDGGESDTWSVSDISSFRYRIPHN